MKKEDIKKELIALIEEVASELGYEKDTSDHIIALVQTLLKGGGISNDDLRDRLRMIGEGL